MSLQEFARELPGWCLKLGLLCGLVLGLPLVLLMAPQSHWYTVGSHVVGLVTLANWASAKIAVWVNPPPEDW